MEFMHFYQCTVVFSNYKHSHKCTTGFNCTGIYLSMTASTYGCWQTHSNLNTVLNVYTIYKCQILALKVLPSDKKLMFLTYDAY